MSQNRHETDALAETQLIPAIPPIPAVPAIPAQSSAQSPQRPENDPLAATESLTAQIGRAHV